MEPISSLQPQLSSTHFAIAQRGEGQDFVSVMAQCRNYLSTQDCLSCVSSAASEIRSCYTSSTNSRVYYDGCSLGYKDFSFFDKRNDGTFIPICGNRSTAASEADGTFGEMVDQLLKDLSSATPRTVGYYAAMIKREEVGGRVVAYGVAQCPLNVSEDRCRECLDLSYKNIQSCPPNTDGKAVDDECFLRYSDTPFFRDNQTTDVSYLLKKCASSLSLSP